MLVSTFEIIFKRLFPDPSNTAVSSGTVTFDRRVVQGYFLSLTNLEQKAYTYAIRFHVSLPPPGLPNPSARLPAGNAIVFFDIAGNNNSAGVISYGGVNIYGPDTPLSRFTIPAQQTALILFFPNPFTLDFFKPINPDIEIRGYVSLTLPALRRRGQGLQSLFYDAQSDKPVRVLLNPETRATFLPDNASDTTFSQTHSLLEVASGKGENLLDPDPSFNLLPTIPVDLGTIIERVNSTPDFLGSAAIAPDDRLVVLLELLAQVEPNDTNLRELNRLLTEAGIPVQLSPNGTK